MLFLTLFQVLFMSAISRAGLITSAYIEVGADFDPMQELSSSAPGRLRPVKHPTVRTQETTTVITLDSSTTATSALKPSTMEPLGIYTHFERTVALEKRLMNVSEHSSPTVSYLVEPGQKAALNSGGNRCTAMTILTVFYTIIAISD